MATQNKIEANIWYQCARCQELIYRKQFWRNLKVCHHCGYHARLNWQERLTLLLDKNSFVELNSEIESKDPLNFQAGSQSYRAKLSQSQAQTKLKEALVTGYGTISDKPVAIAVADFNFMGASMGAAFGEKLVSLIDYAIECRLPVLTVSSSGGARMQEGVVALMQMAKTCVGLSQLGRARLPHISLLTDPCYGGVTASYATAADIILAEPGAMIGFAGPRVIEQTIRQKLPQTFQTAEFGQAHGLIDQVVGRQQLPLVVSRLLGLFERRISSYNFPLRPNRSMANNPNVITLKQALAS